jgi:predicted HTH domain antitoxin
MANVTVEVPQELIDLLGQSALAGLDEPARVRVALALHLFTSERVTLGRAAELAEYALVDFQDLLRELGIPMVVYDREEYERDQQAVDRLHERLNLDRIR